MISLSKWTVALLILVSIVACSKKNEQKPNPLAEKWMENVKEKLPQLLCKEGGYFRECFSVNETECKDQMIQSSDKCLNTLKSDILKSFGVKGTENLSAEGAYWGAKWGECTGIDFEKILSSKVINNEKCKDPKNWMP